jgi:2-methylcitrate dehydratase PrpD
MDSSVHNIPLTRMVAEYSRQTDYAQLPAPVVESAQRVILDTLGSIVLGSTMTPGKLMRQFVATIAGRAQSTVVGGGLSGPAGYAALANGTSAHTGELDASHISWGHPAAVAVPLALALAEERGLGGQELINGVVLTHDIAARVFSALGGRQALLDAHHQHSSAMYSVGAAAAAGRMLRLDETRIGYAIALAVSNISAPAAFFDERHHMTKAMVHGQSAYAGIVGGQLAALGFESNDAILEAKDGVFDLWWTDRADVSVLTDRLGDHYSITDTGYKYYSAGYPIHAPLWGVMSLMREHGLAAGDLAAIRVGMSTQSADIVDSRDTTSICLQDMVSVGAVLGRLQYEDAHDPSLLERDDVRRVRGLITIVRDPEIDARTPRTRAAWVAIDTVSGQQLTSPEQMPPGHWERGGMPWVDVVEKFHGLVDPRLGESVATDIVDLVKDLPGAESVEPLAALLAGPAR